MKSILLGKDKQSGEDVRIPKSAFQTHLHLIGGTGKGKTTAIHTMLHPLLRDPLDPACFIIVDRLGNLSEELLLWMASPDFCTDEVRERLVYLQPAREDCVLPFNPLVYDTQGHGYYKVERATEIILRAWESVNIEAMPRLARWTFNAFWAAAQLGLTIADCAHFLMPGSPFHAPLLQMLPGALRAEWQEITSARSAEAMRILDSSRNRLKPYFESNILRRMFGCTENRLDMARFMREGKIVLIDLAPRNRLASQLANTIGSLIINEVLATARSLPRGQRYNTYLLLDEFQNFIGPDMETALPEVRQLGLRLILSHQGFSQLKKGDYDLTPLIFQAQSRMMFGVQGEDADLLAHELASITFDPRKIKDEVYSRRQLISGHETIELTSWSNADSKSNQWSQTYGKNWGKHENVTHGTEKDTRGEGKSNADSEGRSDGSTSGHTQTRGGHETLKPIYDSFMELSSRTYVSFDEQKAEWAREVRNLATGEALLRLVNDPKLYRVRVKRSTPGYLGYDLETISRQFPEVLEAVDRLIEQNFASNLFMSGEQVDRETELRLQAVLNPPLQITSKPVVDAAAPPTTPTADQPQNPFT